MLVQRASILLLIGLLCATGYILIRSFSGYDDLYSNPNAPVQSPSIHRIPKRLVDLMSKHKIIGENLKFLSDGTETVEELLHGRRHDVKYHLSNRKEENAAVMNKQPMTIEEVTGFLSSFLQIGRAHV